MRSNEWCIVLNPSSGGGIKQIKWKKIQSYLELKGLLGKIYTTKIEQNASRCVQNALKENYRKIIVVGGDGTISNAVNGIFTQDIVSSDEISIGLIPFGTGNDWAKTHGIPKHYKKAIDIINNEKVARQDVGKVEINNSLERYFVNHSGVGFDGSVVNKIGRYKYFGVMSYLIASIFNFWSYKNNFATISFNEKKNNSNFFMISVGLCKYSGGGMRLSKAPDPKDGFFDITLAENFNKLDVIKNLFKLFNGLLYTSKKVTSFKTREINVVIHNNFAYGQADGELLKSSSFKYTIKKNALLFFCKKKDSSRGV
jgi:YegS/Rv2252/BmrU family lipid kinase